MKTEIVVFDRSRIDEIRINGQTVPSLPAQANASDVISIADNGTFIAVLPLDYSRLGHNDPIELTEDDSGHLVISIYNYKGSRTTFWEYKDRKTYFRANMKAGFIVEIGTKREHSSLAEFSRNIAQAKVTDTTDSSYRRTIIYNSGPDEIPGTPDDRCYNQDKDGDGVDDGVAYDRSATATWSGPPDGAITIVEDVLLVLAQTPHGCQVAP